MKKPEGKDNDVEIKRGNPLYFFINGSLNIIKNDESNKNNDFNENKYIMRFLTESIKDQDDEYIRCIIKIVCKDRIGNTLENIYTINGLGALEFDCTQFMEDFNWQEHTKKDIAYEVQLINNNNIVTIYTGVFLIVSPNSTDKLKFVIVSGNDINLSNYNSQKENLWQKIEEKNPDVILHIGNQIYGDYIYKKGIGKTCDIEDGFNYNYDIIYNEYASLYRKTYSDEIQGKVMRLSLNIMIMNDHDIINNFGTPHTEYTNDNKYFTPYYFNGMRAYINYQYQLHSNITDQYMRKLLNGMGEIHFCLNIGKYKLIGLDERYELYHKKILFSDNQLRWLRTILAINESDNYNVIILSSKPFGNMSTGNAYVKSFIENEGNDELLHPNNSTRTQMLLDIIYKKKDVYKFAVATGSVKNTYINEISSATDGLPFIKQLAINNLNTKVLQCGIFSIFMEWIREYEQSFIFNNYTISKKIMLKNCGNSFGFIEDDKFGSY